MEASDDIIERRVESPLTEYAQWKAEQLAGIIEPGTTLVRVNLRTKIGGLANIPPFNAKTGKGKRRVHHELAAETFLNRYEAAYGAVLPAVDAEKTPVDTSLTSNHDGAAVARCDNATLIRVAELHLGTRDFERILSVVFFGVPIEETAPLLPSGKPNWRYVDREVDALLTALDRLAEHWGMAVVRRVA